MKPPYMMRKDIPKELLDKEKALLLKDVKATKKEIVDKILEGKLKKFYQDLVFLDMEYLLDDSQELTIGEYIKKELSENVSIGKHFYLS